MRRIIGMISGILILYYLSVIYKSGGLLFATYFSVVLLAFMFLYAIWSSCHLEISVYVPDSFIDFKRKIRVKIIIRNKSILPTGKIKISIEEKYLMFQKKVRKEYTVSVKGRKLGEKNTQSLEIYMDCFPRYIGRLEFCLRKTSVYDLFGLFSINLSKKRRKSNGILAVLPEKYDMSINFENKKINTDENQLYHGMIQQEIDDLYQFREYRPGDRINKVCWKLTAKNEELMVLQHQSSFRNTLVVVLSFETQPHQKNKEKLLMDAYFSLVYSMLFHFIEMKQIICLMWYDTNLEMLIQKEIQCEEEIYDVMSFYLQNNFYIRNPEIKSVIDTHYKELTGVKKILINDKLQIFSDEKIIKEYSVSNLKESLNSDILFL